jgi:hypothetical protein
MKVFIKTICLASLLAVSLQAKADEDLVAAQKFYEEYLQAGYTYDAAIVEMYTENALSHIKTFTADGKISDKIMAGDEIRKALKLYVENGAKDKIKIVYENAAYSLDASGVKVMAQVNYHHLCYKDNDYWALLARDKSGSYKVKEEFFKIPEKSLCEAK